jgi:ATP-dependent RNA helicase DDX56/DBP9
VNSRIHVVEEFNRNVYDIIIASDEKSEMFGDEKSPEDEEEEAKEQAEAEDGAEEPKKKQKKAEAETEDSSSQPKKKRKVSRKDPEYGVSRGTLFASLRGVQLLTSVRH